MTDKTKGSVQSLLLSLGIISVESVEEFYPRVRDRDDVRVMRCRRSGVIFLSAAPDSDYSRTPGFSYWSAATREEALLNSREDDERRAQQFGSLIRNGRWLDVGTGAGGMLDLLAKEAAIAVAVEPQPGPRAELTRVGYRVYADIQQVPDSDFDVVTLFHVLEHLPEPIETLRLIADRMRPGANLVVEVPHARDFLIAFLNLEAFKRFTFWSEHFILHTRQSLELFLREAQFIDIRVDGFQRYPLANHLYWLATGEPGGHKHWEHLQTEDVNRAYAQMLGLLDFCDTLIAVAKK